LTEEDLMITAGELIRKKGGGIWTIERDETVYAAMKLMAEKDAGALLVMGDGNKIAGIISERDCVRKVDVESRSSRETRVVAIMTEKVLYVDANQPLEEVMALMGEKNFRHMPVMDGSKLLGIISMRDVLKEVVVQQKFLISQLEHYIQG
jgi:CBS domain-containing protein